MNAQEKAQAEKVAAEQALLEQVAGMTADEADALAGSQAVILRDRQGEVESAMFGPAVTLARLIHLGTVVKGRVPKDKQDVLSFGAWGTKHGYAGSTVTLLVRLGQAIGHGITPGSDPEVWAAAVQKGTNAQVGEALGKKPGPKNSEKARQTLIAARDGNLPKVPRKPGTPDGTDDESTEKAVTAINGKSIEAIVMGLRNWVETDGNLSVVNNETLVAIRAHFADMAELVEAEGHRRIATSKKTGRKATDAALATAV